MAGQKKRGFTFLELIIILLIAGTLAAIAVPRFISFQREAQLAVEKQQVGTVKVGINSYYIQSITSNRFPQYPPVLDSAGVSSVSHNNPFFGFVVASPGIISPSGWRKLSALVYQGPSGLFYFYDPSSGQFNQEEVLSEQIMSLLKLKPEDITIDLINQLGSGNVLNFAGGLQLIGGSAVLTPRPGGEPSVTGSDTGQQIFGNFNGSVNAQITSENAGWANSITFGYYTLDPVTGNKVLHQIFNGPDSTGASKNFSVNQGNAVGFYFTTPQNSGYTYYSQTASNPDNTEHIKVYQNEALHKITFGLEDTLNGGDKDYQDMVITLSY